MAKKNKLSPLAITGIIIALVVVLVLFTFIGTYNTLVQLDETVNEKWANVQSAYQRRIDLIPNLVATVQGAADFEKELQTQVTAMRSGLSGAKTPEDLELLGTKIESAINLVFERYPAVRATENFLSLQDQLEGTENRIKTERDIYNAAVKSYSVKTRTFPSNMIAGMFGFEKRDPFEADEGADVAPTVEFS